MNNLKNGLNAWLPQSEPTAEKPFKGKDGNWYAYEIEALLSDPADSFLGINGAWINAAQQQMNVGYVQMAAQLINSMYQQTAACNQTNIHQQGIAQQLNQGMQVCQSQQNTSGSK